MVASPCTPPWRKKDDEVHEEVQDEVKDEEKDEVKDEEVHEEVHTPPFDDEVHTPPLTPEDMVASPCTPPDAFEVSAELLHCIDMRAENEAAKAAKVRWQDRGPPGPDALPEGQTKWRGQRWRAGGQGGQARWGNCGGRHKEWWTAFYAAKHAGKMKAFLEANPKPK